MSTLTSYLLLAGCVILEGASAQELSPVVQTEQGYVRGVESYDKQYYEYMGIPYATLTSRFGTAGPPRSWQGIFEANSDAIECIQLNGTHIVGQEDCLVLNVYVPKNIPRINLLPLMVFIHGGANIRRSGSRKNAGAPYLVNKGVIVVTLNYRLGAFGYLCLRVKEAPGNMAFKDQVAALKWVNRNIRAFGGDPGGVTLAGHSSGAVSVSLHLLSSMSTGLFQQGVILSGSAIMSAAVEENPVEKAAFLTKLMYNRTDNIEDTLAVLINADAYDLLRASELIFKNTDVSMPFGFCLENYIAGEEGFLTKNPYNILKSGNYTAVPIIIGFTDNEGLQQANFYNLNLVDEHFEWFIPHDLTFVSEDEKISVAQKIRSFYFTSDPLEYDIQNYVNFFSDIYFTYSCRTTSLLHHKTTTKPVFNYMYQYDGGRNYIKQGLQRKFNQLPGASHADDVMYIFEPELIPSKVIQADQQIIDRLTTLLTNFVKYGDPTPATTPLLPVKWLPMNATHDNYLVIDSVMSITEQPFRERMQFWDELYAKYRKNYLVVVSEGNVQFKTNFLIVIAAIPIVLY